MFASKQAVPSELEERLSRLTPEHRRCIARFEERLTAFTARGMLSEAQRAIVLEHLVRLGERGRNPANTGNIEDLFCHTFLDTRDAIRAFAQALADSIKIVPMEPDARLFPALRDRATGRRLQSIRDFAGRDPADTMLVTHTMVAFGDPEMWESAAALVAVTRPELDGAGIEREVARMAVQSQHLPSSTFVLARAHGLTVECDPLYPMAGYSRIQTAHAQRFYDICSEFEPRWAEAFVRGQIPSDGAWRSWRASYLGARAHLPPELIYQLSSDTLTNFLDGTLESGKWTDASVLFGGVTDPSEIPRALEAIVNQYIAEHVALHDRPALELERACEGTLAPWGIGFVEGRAQVMDCAPPRAASLRAQFEAAWKRKASGAW